MFIISAIIYFIFCLTYISSLLLVSALPWAIGASFFGLIRPFQKVYLIFYLKLAATFIATGLYLHYLSTFDLYRFVETIENNWQGCVVSLSLLQVYFLGYIISIAKEKYRGLQK